MKLKIIPLLLAAIAPTLMGTTARHSVQPLVQSGAVTSSVMVAVDQDFFVETFTGGETVHFTGQLHVVTVFFPTDPVFPNDPIRIHTNVIGLRGVGETSGLTYHVTGASSFTANYTAGSTNNLFNAYYKLLPPSPIKPLSSSLRFSYNVSFDAVGKLTDVIADITVEEGP